MSNIGKIVLNMRVERVYEGTTDGLVLKTTATEVKSVLTSPLELHQATQAVHQPASQVRYAGADAHVPSSAYLN